VLQHIYVKISPLVFLLAVLSAAEAQTTINAASCNASDVQAALNKINSNGTTVSVPAGHCTWTSGITFSSAYSFTLQGQSAVATTNAQGNPATITDSTMIVDGQSGGGGNNPLIGITLTGNSSQVVRVTGLSIQGGNVVYNGEVALGGATGQARLDHFHFINVNDLAVSMYQPMSGVVDHNIFDVPNGDVFNGIRVYNTGGDGFGDTAWTMPPGLGTGSAIFFENNTFNNGFMNDCALGGFFVARFNTFNALAPDQNLGIQSHAVGSQPRGRGCRAWEVYDNTVGGGGGTIISSVGFQTAGTGVWWGNTVTNTKSDIVFDEDRDNTNTYPQSSPPNGWGYCGTAQTGSASGWDGNTSSTGYPCLDQIGRGQGDMLSGMWPQVQDTSHPSVFTGAWPNEVLQPVYIWMENFSGTGPLVGVSSSENNIQANRDYYVPVSPFTGATGTGYGAYASIPTTCTTGVAYWATDKNQLYTCTATNTWSLYYAPYTYPHPLVTGTSPAPPISLSGTILNN
jgi:hypothetical protein